MSRATGSPCSLSVTDAPSGPATTRVTRPRSRRSAPLPSKPSTRLRNTGRHAMAMDVPIRPQMAKEALPLGRRHALPELRRHRPQPVDDRPPNEPLPRKRGGLHCAPGAAMPSMTCVRRGSTRGSAMAPHRGVGLGQAAAGHREHRSGEPAGVHTQREVDHRQPGADDKDGRPLPKPGRTAFGPWIMKHHAIRCALRRKIADRQHERAAFQYAPARAGRRYAASDLSTRSTSSATRRTLPPCSLIPNRATLADSDHTDVAWRTFPRRHARPCPAIARAAA